MIASVLDRPSQEVRWFGFGIRLFQAGRFGSSIWNTRCDVGRVFRYIGLPDNMIYRLMWYIYTFPSHLTMPRVGHCHCRYITRSINQSLGGLSQSNPNIAINIFHLCSYHSHGNVLWQLANRREIKLYYTASTNFGRHLLGSPLTCSPLI